MNYTDSHIEIFHTSLTLKFVSCRYRFVGTVQIQVHFCKANHRGWKLLGHTFRYRGL